MGLFDQFSHLPTNKDVNIYQPQSDIEAWIGVLYACMSCDGNVSHAELDTISRLMLSKKKFWGLSIAPYYKRVAAAKAKIGLRGLVEACCPMIKIEDREMIFAMSVEIVLSDGILESDEEKIITLLAKKLDIAPAMVNKIIEVMLILNKGGRVVK